MYLFIQNFSFGNVSSKIFFVDFFFQNKVSLNFIYKKTKYHADIYLVIQFNVFIYNKKRHYPLSLQATYNNPLKQPKEELLKDKTNYSNKK